MVTHDRIGRLAQQIGERLQGASQAPEEVQKGIQQVVRGAFDRLELVSREDFDILMDVLQRTRSRVEALEKQVASLEALVESQAGDGTASAAADKPQVSADGEAPTPPEEDAGAGEAGR
ncbi:accessory factor UbiK family protein [Halomonas sp. SSL-5]|uniref:accessory factor UbiK family protein n=1 Tax=Halomonas sp. SSL-5 TaxID=3065855 RepID=UPI0027388E5A|nr:accessory factor UbiK family protein [Halomonas sp. SSL-5]MDY7116319.1 accessory factor UbiK family protein [Halomonas sp. SSL-5]